MTSRVQLSPDLVRLELGDLNDFESTRTPDEWVGLVVPGQFQSRYYTVRRFDDAKLTLDVVIHEAGLVTDWISRDCVGETVTITDAKGSFGPPEGVSWLILACDLTGLPAAARILEQTQIDDVQVFAEVKHPPPGYLPADTKVTWLPVGSVSRLAETVESLDWPGGDGYFWMAGESAQMRAIRKYLMRVRQMPSDNYNVMGYWRAGKRRLRAADPGPIWRAGKAAGKSDEEIWAQYDAARAKE